MLGSASPSSKTKKHLNRASTIREERLERRRAEAEGRDIDAERREASGAARIFARATPFCSCAAAFVCVCVFVLLFFFSTGGRRELLLSILSLFLVCLRFSAFHFVCLSRGRSLLL